MKVLLLRRQSFGGIATYSDHLLEGLREAGVAVRVEDVSDWIPNDTRGSFDKEVTKKLLPLAREYDLVHAFGYRAAWACAEALGKKLPWIYTAYDLPKTTHPELVARLDKARVGLAVSRAVKSALDEALVSGVKLLTPGIPRLPDPGNQEECKESLGIDPDWQVILAMGSIEGPEGLDVLADGMEEIWRRIPYVQLCLASSDGRKDYWENHVVLADRPDRVSIFGKVKGKEKLFGAADLVVVPARVAGFSMVALEAMSLGTPSLVRRAGGLSDLVDERFSGLCFEDDEDLSRVLASGLQATITLESMRNACRVRFEERHDFEACIAAHEAVYRRAVS